MNYAKVIFCDIANGKGCRTTLFVSGCKRHCKGCFNSQAWDFKYGDPFTEEIKNKILKSLEPKYIKGLSILGGEPLEDENKETVLNLILDVRKYYPDKDIWLYTGNTLEELEIKNDPVIIQILNNIDFLVDGEFKEAEKDITLSFRGSKNQKIINMKNLHKKL